MMEYIFKTDLKQHTLQGQPSTVRLNHREIVSGFKKEQNCNGKSAQKAISAN